MESQDILAGPYIVKGLSEGKDMVLMLRFTLPQLYLPPFSSAPLLEALEPEGHAQYLNGSSSGLMMLDIPGICRSHSSSLCVTAPSGCFFHSSHSRQLFSQTLVFLQFLMSSFLMLLSFVTYIPRYVLSSCPPTQGLHCLPSPAYQSLSGRPTGS